MNSLRIVFFGTAGIACPSLRALHATPGATLAAVVTQPERPRGRDLKLSPGPIKEAAAAIALPVLQPAQARDPEFIHSVRLLEPDLGVVMAYGQILPPSLLDVPRLGCVNLHTSILPRHRGAAPIQWTLLLGDHETGVTLMQMDAGLDTGGILAIERTPVTATDTARSLHDRLAVIGASLLIRSLPAIAAGHLRPSPQPATGVTYARKLTKQDGAIDWSQPLEIVWNRIRACVPWPGAFSFIDFSPLPSPAPRRVKILEATPDPAHGMDSAFLAPGTVLRAERAGILVACGAGDLWVNALQLDGGRPLRAAEFLAGHPLTPGTSRFQSVPAARDFANSCQKPQTSK